MKNKPLDFELSQQSKHSGDIAAYDGTSNFEKWYYWRTRKSIFNPIEDRLELLIVHMVTQKGRPRGSEKSPSYEVYSSKYLKVVRVREIPEFVLVGHFARSTSVGTLTR